MNRLSKKFFPGSGFANDQNRTFTTGDFLESFDFSPNRVRVPNDPAKREGFVDLFPKQTSLTRRDGLFGCPTDPITKDINDDGFDQVIVRGRPEFAYCDVAAMASHSLSPDPLPSTGEGSSANLRIGLKNASRSSSSAKYAVG